MIVKSLIIIDRFCLDKFIFLLVIYILDGVLLFSAESLGIPRVKPYLGIKNIGRWSVEEGGANFAVIGATALDFSFFEERGVPVKTNYSLSAQLNWFKELLPTLCNSSTGRLSIIFSHLHRSTHTNLF